MRPSDCRLHADDDRAGTVALSLPTDVLGGHVPKRRGMDRLDDFDKGPSTPKRARQVAGTYVAGDHGEQFLEQAPPVEVFLPAAAVRHERQGVALVLPRYRAPRASDMKGRGLGTFGAQGHRHHKLGPVYQLDAHAAGVLDFDAVCAIALDVDRSHGVSHPGADGPQAIHDGVGERVGKGAVAY